MATPPLPPTEFKTEYKASEYEFNGSEDSGSKDSSWGGGKEEFSSADAEGVWSPDIEQSFQEALTIYPPCGRRKIILQDEGKMYGRNELIARYIKLRTGKTRTRKQVSSHIQVLARKKSRELQAKMKDQAAKDKTLQSLQSLTSAQILSSSGIQNQQGITSLMQRDNFTANRIWLPQPSTSKDIKPFAIGQSNSYPSSSPNMNSYKDVKPFVGHTQVSGGYGDQPMSMPVPWDGRAIATHKLSLVVLSAFMEQPSMSQEAHDPENGNYHKNFHLFVHIGGFSDTTLESVDIRQIYDKFPERNGGLKELYDKGPYNAFFLVKFWADLNTDIHDNEGVFYGMTSQYESFDDLKISCSTKICSFGKQVVEKVETQRGRFENGRYVYRIQRSPMCEYMISFIRKLKHLPEDYMMNSVLENFTILQVLTDSDTQETLLCLAFVFEVSTSEHGAQHHIYRLIKESS